MTPPLDKNNTPNESAPPKPVPIESFQVMGCNTVRLLQRIKEEGEDVWFDER